MAAKNHGGRVGPVGTVKVRQLDPELLAKAKRQVEALEITTRATARYEDGNGRVRLYATAPYDTPTGERTVTVTLDVDDETGSAFDEVFGALVEAHLPELLQRAKLGAATALMQAQRDEVDE